MKLRITEDTIRLRLTEKECEALSNNERIANTVIFPLGEQLQYSITVAENLNLTFENNHIQVSMTHDQVQVLLQKEMVNTSFTPTGHVMHLIVEQDLKRGRSGLSN